MLGLGFWWDSHLRVGGDAAPRPRWAELARWLYRRRAPWIKLASLLRETFGRFGGPSKRDWFLTDGGHFENTSACALPRGEDPPHRARGLRRRSALPVHRRREPGAQGAHRPAGRNRILQAEGDAASALGRGHDAGRGRASASAPTACWPTWSKQFGSLNELASDDSDACFALASIRYCGIGDAQRSWLLLVKPNLRRGLPVDLFNFKDDHPAFPQQGTADQFFDEAQWESYFQLGRVLGSD